MNIIYIGIIRRTICSTENVQMFTIDNHALIIEKQLKFSKIRNFEKNLRRHRLVQVDYWEIDIVSIDDVSGREYINHSKQHGQMENLFHQKPRLDYDCTRALKKNILLQKKNMIAIFRLT